MWMTPYSRNVLRRYPEILSLDMQSKQYNVFNWPYCSLIFHGGENRGEQGCECIVCEESTDMYYWIITTCIEMEPAFDISKIRVIFADNGIKQELLKSLHIENTCFLHCDPYHQMVSVWPKYLNNKFHPIEQYLKAIIESETQDQFDVSCNMIHKTLSKHDRGLADSFFDELKSRYKYYAGYYLILVTGMMAVNGSYQAEQNHAGNTAYLGNGDHLTIEKQMEQLITRQQCRITKYDEDLCKWEQLGLHYKNPQHNGLLKIGDSNARKSLTNWAFNNLWEPQLQAGKCLIMEEENDTYLFWYYKKTRETATNIHVLKKGERCNCPTRLQYLCQCKHEIRVRNTFVKDMWASRHFNPKTYAELYPSESNNMYDVNSDKSDTDDVEFLESTAFANNDSATNLSTKKKTLGNMYCQTLRKCTDLCRILQNDNTELCRVKSHIEQIISHLQSGVKVNYCVNVSSEENKRKHGIVYKRTKTNKTAYNQKRLKPITEQIRCNPTHRNSNLSSKGCTICTTTGHTKLSCPLIIGDTGLSPIPSEQKINFAKKLLSDCYPTTIINEEPAKPYASYKSKVCGLRVHGKYQFNNKIYCKCSIYREKDPDGPEVNNKWFDIHLVTKLITRNKDTVVINEMEEIINLSQDVLTDISNLGNNNNNNAQNSIYLNHINTIPGLQHANNITSIWNQNQLQLGDIPHSNFQYGQLSYPTEYATIPLSTVDPYSQRTKGIHKDREDI